MSNAVTVIKQGSVVAMQWNQEQIDLIKRTICKDATNDELKLFLHVAQRSGLDPFTKQIHSVKRFSAKTNGYEMQIQVGIDGFRLIAQRTGQYAGSDDPIFDDEIEPTKATVTVYKMISGQRCPFVATARWAEYYPGDKQGFMWKKMPCLMLGKVAESLALRKAFPSELSGLYTTEEMEQADQDTNKPVIGEHFVRPEQPGPGDGIPDISYVIPFGKYKQRRLEEVSLDDLRSYINYLEDKAKKEGKELKGQVLDFINRASEFVACFENGSEE